MRPTSTIAIVATAVFCLLGASQVEATTPTCAVKDSHGNFVFCPYLSDCNVSTKRQPACRGGDGKYIKGVVGDSCYLVTDHNDPAGSGTKACGFHCSSTDGKGGSSCM